MEELKVELVKGIDHGPCREMCGGKEASLLTEPMTEIGITGKLQEPPDERVGIVGFN